MSLRIKKIVNLCIFGLIIIGFIVLVIQVRSSFSSVSMGKKNVITGNVKEVDQYKCTNSFWFTITKDNKIQKNDLIFMEFLNDQSIKKKNDKLFERSPKKSDPKWTIFESFKNRIDSIEKDFGSDWIYKMTFDEICEDISKINESNIRKISKEEIIINNKEIFIDIALFRYAVGLSSKNEILRVTDLLCAIESTDLFYQILNFLKPSKRFDNHTKYDGLCLRFKYDRQENEKHILSSLIYNHKNIDNLYFETLAIWYFLGFSNKISEDFVKNLFEERDNELRQMINTIKNDVSDWEINLNISYAVRNTSKSLNPSTETFTLINQTVRSVLKLLKEYISNDEIQKRIDFGFNVKTHKDYEKMKKNIFIFNLFENLPYFINTFKISDLTHMIKTKRKSIMIYENTGKNNFTKNNFELLSDIFISILEKIEITEKETNKFNDFIEDINRTRTTKNGIDLNIKYRQAKSSGCYNFYAFIFTVLCDAFDNSLKNLKLKDYEDICNSKFPDMWDEYFTRTTPFSSYVEEINKLNFSLGNKLHTNSIKREELN